MDKLRTLLHVWSPYLLSAMRIIVGALFLEHGTSKILHFPPSPMTMPLNGMALTSGYIELIAGALILVGFGTRIAAFIASGEMAVAYFMVHAPHGFFPIDPRAGGNGGEMAILYCFVFLYLVVVGSGPISLDALFAKYEAAPAPDGARDDAERGIIAGYVDTGSRSPHHHDRAGQHRRRVGAAARRLAAGGQRRAGD